ncbi:MAG: PefC/AfrB family outer membrane usher protein [Bacteroidales bacterium]
MYISFCIVSTVSASELNYGFLQGVSSVPPVFRKTKEAPRGKYFVDVFYNSANIGRRELVISEAEEDNGVLCLSEEWISNLGVNINLDYYSDFYSQNNQCYEMGREVSTGVRFDFNTQSVRISIPQAYQLEDNDESLWDYGVSGGKLTYYANFLKNSQDDKSSVFSSFNGNVNVGEWVLTSNFSLSNGVGNDKFSTQDVVLSRAVSSIGGDVIVGKTNTVNELFPDFSFYGVSARSNLNMKPWEVRGYAPVVSGVAQSTSRITVSQDGNVVFSKVVPPGPYSINDINPSGNGDLTVVVEDSSGNKKVSKQAVATLPTLLRSGSYNYNFAIGRKSSVLDSPYFKNEPFIFGSLDYGFSFSTLSIASILHRNYQSFGVGITSNLGKYGAVFLSGNMARAKYVDNEDLLGKSFSIKYSKLVGDATDIQLLAYRYQDDDYVDFVDFGSIVQPLHRDKKERYEAMLSHRFDGFYISSSAWFQTYRNTNSNDIGINLSANTSTSNGISLNINAAYNKVMEYKEPDYSLSVGISIPFNVGGVAHYGTTGFGYSNGGSPSYNVGVSASDEQLSYSVNTNMSADGKNVTANVGYGFDSVQTNVTLAKGNEHSTLSGSASGSIVVTRPTGIVFTKELGDTVALIKIPNIKGVQFGNSGPTNANGVTALYLSDYSRNDVSIDMENVPRDIELLHTSYRIVPTEKALIYREFGYENIQRYILRVLDKQGDAISAGGKVVTDDGYSAGFVANNGVVLMSLRSKPKRISIVEGAKEATCNVDLTDVKVNLERVQEVRCE